MTWQTHYSRKSIEDVVAALKSNGPDCTDRSIKPATILIGAGCSISGGIPLAKKMVELNKKDFQRQYKMAVETYKIDHPDDKNYNGLYPYFMAQLTPAQRDSIIAAFLPQERINWAHLSIAQLLKHGYLGRVLTVNFDRLLPKAMALVGEFPALYDKTAIRMAHEFQVIPDKAVFYLHGQGGSTPLIHRKEDSAKHAQEIRPFLTEALQRGPVIIAGYSGGLHPIGRTVDQVTSGLDDTGRRTLPGAHTQDWNAAASRCTTQ